MIYTQNRVVLGLIEEIYIIDKHNKKHKTLAKIDTGASKSSIDQALAKELGMTEVIKKKIIRNSHGKTERDVVNLTFEIKDKIIEAQVTIADRKDMKYHLLVGQNVLKKGEFLIDPLKKRD